ncbi:MAG TPA: hypothetical protein VM870_10300 [Pyrinomonadaceae bacterium]|jgi:hypothetical protein|nr:hypothetical protein [Pyrinomonadaceae bacterium]
MRQSPSKLVVAFLASLYFLWCAFRPFEWRLLDGVNLVIHEAGHLIFLPFGEFLMIAGGSLFQVIMPSLFVGYFFRREQRFSGSLTLFWVGHSLLNVSVYAGDAVAMQLPLLGGSDSIHDWRYLLERTDLLPHTAFVGNAIRALATLVIMSATILSFAFAKTNPDEVGESAF